MQLPVNQVAVPKKTDDTEIKSVYAAKPSKPAADAHAPFALEFKPPEKSRPPVARAPAEQRTEQVFQERSQEERRKYCRRLQNVPVLYDLRVGADRRRKNQRKSDITTAIDEKV